MKTIYWVLGFVLLTTGTAFSAPLTAPEYFAMGLQLYTAKDYQGGYYAYEAGLKQDPNNAAGYQGLGDCLYGLGRQSEALGAFQQSLVLNPNNPQLATFVKSFKPLDTIAVETNKTKVVYTDEELGISTPTPTAQGVTTVSHAEAKYGLFKDGWIRGYAGYDYAVLGNLISGVQAWGPDFVANGEPGNTPTNSVGNSGIRAGAEIGLNVDKSNTLSINVENVWTQNESYNNGASATDPTLQTGSFQPNLTSVTLNYTVDFITSKSAKTYFTFGAGYYHATVNALVVTPYPNAGLQSVGLSVPATISGTFTGDVLGGTLGVGQILAIGDSFGLEFSARVRFATFGQMTASSLTSNGQSVPAPTGGFVLVTDNSNTINMSGGTTNLGGEIDVDTFAGVGTTDNVMTLDYSGFYSDLSFNFYF